MADSIKGFCTKYALSRGIYPVTVRRSSSGNARYLYTTGRDAAQLVVCRDFFTDRSAAEEAAKAAAAKRIVSLKRQIRELESLVETPKWLEEKL